MTNGRWIDDNTGCCGDDLGEGGFPYGVYNGVPEAHSQTSDDAGEYRTGEICDDYYDDNPTDMDSWIDNDCANGANCKDGNCYSPAGDGLPARGPSGGYCCGGNAPENRCKDAIDPSARSSNGVACGDNLECDCIAVDGETNEDHGEANVGETITTCVPPQIEYPEDFESSYDRKFLVDDVSGCIIISIEDIDGDVGEESACEGNVDCSTDESYVWFQNSAGEDCLITVEIN